MFVIALFATFGMMPFAFYIRSLDGISKRVVDGKINIPLAVIANLFLIGLLVGLYFISRYFLLVYINTNKQQIAFLKPLLFQYKQYSFEEIIGFHYSFYYNRGTPYRILNIKIKNGKSYKFSDFEISNFRTFENILYNNFDMIRTETSTKFTEEEKHLFVTNTKRKIELKQAKEIRVAFSMIAILCSLILTSESIDLGAKKLPNTALILFAYLLIYSIYKITKAIRFISTNNLN